MFSEDLFKLRETHVERVRPQAALFQEFINIFNQSDLAKHALIVERKSIAVRESKNDARVRRRFLLVFEITEKTRHAEMQPQPDIVAGAHEQMFSVTPTAFELPTLQFAREFRH